MKLPFSGSYSVSVEHTSTHPYPTFHGNVREGMGLARHCRNELQDQEDFQVPRLPENAEASWSTTGVDIITKARCRDTRAACSRTGNFWVVDYKTCLLSKALNHAANGKSLLAITRIGRNRRPMWHCVRSGLKSSLKSRESSFQSRATSSCIRRGHSLPVPVRS